MFAFDTNSCPFMVGLCLYENILSFGMILVLDKSNTYSLKLKNIIMRSLLYLIAVILVIAWIFGAFVTPFGGNIIHVLLVIAIIALLLGVIRRA